MTTPLLDNLSARLDASGRLIQQTGYDLLALRVRILAGTLYGIADRPEGRRRRRQARRLFHKLSQLRRRLTASPDLANVEVLQPAHTHIETLIDASRELMG